eukprot:3472269-Rhodomonas_salina.3
MGLPVRARRRCGGTTRAPATRWYGLRACYAMSGMGIAYGAVCLRACYAMPGTDPGYGAPSERRRGCRGGGGRGGGRQGGEERRRRRGQGGGAGMGEGRREERAGGGEERRSAEEGKENALKGHARCQEEAREMPLRAEINAVSFGKSRADASSSWHDGMPYQHVR